MCLVYCELTINSLISGCIECCTEQLLYRSWPSWTGSHGMSALPHFGQAQVAAKMAHDMAKMGQGTSKTSQVMAGIRQATAKMGQAMAKMVQVTAKMCQVMAKMAEFTAKMAWETTSVRPSTLLSSTSCGQDCSRTVRCHEGSALSQFLTPQSLARWHKTRPTRPGSHGVCALPAF